jgi:serine/threonine-protein kinase
VDSPAAAGTPCPHCGAKHQPGETCPARGDAAARTPTEPATEAPAAGGTALGAPPSIAPSADPLLGAMVGSFRVQRLLGRGGMGAVYLAEHPVIGSRVAIKFLHESLASNAELVGRFYDEARAVNLIGHENIVAVYDLALLPPSRYYIVMEYLEGMTLAALVRQGTVPQDLALDVLAQLTGALQAAHERGVIHRDLKPENVFLVKRHDTEHFVKLVDFGIAKLGDRAGGTHTASGMIVGTPEYMAPEQCDNRTVDARTDVYALGVMAYEVATGRLPFAAKGIAQVLLAQLRQAPAPPRQLRPDIHPAFERVILKALEKRPEDRYADMRAMGEALRAAAAELAGKAAAVAAAPTVRRPTPLPAAAPPAEAPAAPPPRPPPPAARKVEVDVRVGGAARRLPAAEVSKGGLFLASRGELPPLFSRVEVLLRTGSRTVALPGEVVRHVSPAQAAGWKMDPGFAVQLGPLGPAERAALEELRTRLQASPPAADRETIDGATALALLESLERRAAAGHYELLDARLDAGLPEMRERARGLKRQVEDLRAKLPPQAQVARVTTLLERIEQAAQVLGSPSERLLHDARRGNFRGVACCVVAGAPLAAIESRRRSFLAERPGQLAEAQRRLARSQVARKMGNEEAALVELEAALQADPLDMELHELHAELEARLRLRQAPA